MIIENINRVKNNKVTITLSSNELVLLGNVLYKNRDYYKDSVLFHALYSNIVIARAITIYGLIDDFDLDSVVVSREKIKNIEEKL